MWVVQRLDQDAGGVVELRMRVALGEKAQQPGHVGDAVEGERGTDQPGDRGFLGLDPVGTEPVVEASAPGEPDPVPGLEHRLHPPRAPAVDEAEMAPVRAGQRLQHRAGLPVPAHAQNDALVGPLHG